MIENGLLHVLIVMPPGAKSDSCTMGIILKKGIIQYPNVCDKKLHMNALKYHDIILTYIKFAIFLRYGVGLGRNNIG